MLEVFYDWFLGGENKDIMWFSTADGGLDAMSIGFGWMLGVTAVVTVIFYFVICRRAAKATLRNWLIFGAINAVAVFFCVWIIVANISEQEGLDGLWYDKVFLFSFINGLLYGTLFYILISLVVKRFTVNASHLPTSKI